MFFVKYPDPLISSVVEAAFDLGADLDEDEVKDTLSQIRVSKREGVTRTLLLPVFLFFDLVLRGKKGISARLKNQKEVFKFLATPSNTLSRRHHGLHMRK